MSIRRFNRDEDGGLLVEVTVMIPIIFLFILGAIDFLFLFYQWNAAAKAVQVGARIAAVSTPVTNGLNALSNAVVSVSNPIGSPMPYFKVTCGAGSCGCAGTCTGVSGYNAAAMNTIVYGRGSNACNDATSFYNAGMCDVFDRIGPANVSIIYEQTGLGFAGRSSGPVPTVTVSLQNLPFQFFFLGGLMGFANINIPATATVTGEDLSSSYP
jgi:Flp pilus assembly protein TadG